MLNWSTVSEEEFTNLEGIQTQVKLRYEFINAESTKTIDPKNRDLDLIAFDELGDESGVMDVIQENKIALVEYDWDISKLREIKIPL